MYMQEANSQNIQHSMKKFHIMMSFKESPGEIDWNLMLMALYTEILKCLTLL